MELGGKAWRGFFPVGDELTSGQPDLKEGIYFGTELNENNPKVVRGLPMQGKNLFLRLEKKAFPSFDCSDMPCHSTCTNVMYADTDN